MELIPLGDLPVLPDDPRTGHHLHATVQHPVHDDLGWSTFRFDPCGYDDVCVENDQSHPAFRRRRALRTWSISRSISSSLIWLAPDSLARRQLSWRLALAMARRSSRSSRATSLKSSCLQIGRA